MREPIDDLKHAERFRELIDEGVKARLDAILGRR
jgi:hypothetical protein